uniref:Secreted protein n=1 Tax=Mesocestoides corti TaxID=53468 RepID=A0A5K3EYJ9_MESCO
TALQPRKLVITPSFLHAFILLSLLTASKCVSLLSNQKMLTILCVLLRGKTKRSATLWISSCFGKPCQENLRLVDLRFSNHPVSACRWLREWKHDVNRINGARKCGLVENEVCGWPVEANQQCFALCAVALRNHIGRVQSTGQTWLSLQR